MNSFKVITLQDRSEWACNKEGEGVFTRQQDGTWLQHRGTGQTPLFKTAQQLSRYIRSKFTGYDMEPLPKMVKSSGW
jgi:hypothetical protein